jgi:hypothetical protein
MNGLEKKQPRRGGKVAAIVGENVSDDFSVADWFVVWTARVKRECLNKP